MIRSLSMILLCAASLSTGCGRTPLGPKGDTQLTCDPSCDAVCAATIDRCGSLSTIDCRTHCQDDSTSPVNLCLRQLTCDSPAASCDLVWGCQTNPQVADLTIRSYTADSPMARKLRWRVEVCNNGNGPSLATQLALYLQRGAAPEVGDIGDAQLTVQGLSPQQCTTLEHTQDVFATDRYKTWAQVDPKNGVVELREDNNHGGPQTVDVRGSVSKLPELRVRSLSGYREGSHVLHYDVEVCNAGEQAAEYVRLDLYYNRATPPTPTSAGNRSRLIPMLAGESCVRMSINGHLQNGVKPIKSWAYIDRRDRINESNESNNVFGPVQIGDNGSRPDLLISQAVAQVNGSQVSYSAKVCNVGSQTSTATNLRLYYSSIGQPTAAMTPSQQRSVPTLTAGKCTTVTFTATLKSGTYTSGFYVDAPNLVSETNENNNAYYPLFVSVGNTTGPQLTLNGFTAVPSAGRVEYQIRICNIGNQPSLGSPSIAPKIKLYDNLGWPPSAYDTSDRTVAVPRLEPGQCTDLKSSATLAPGVYNAWARVMAYGHTSLAGPRTFTISGALADLYVKVLTPVPTASDVKFLITVCNQGTSTSTGTDVQVHIDTKPTPTSPQPQPYKIPPLLSGACVGVQTLSTPVGGGNHTVWAWVNRLGSVQEGNTSNNIYGPVPFYVSGTVNQPDLRISSFKASSTSGGNVTYQLTVCNSGQSGAVSTTLALFYTYDPSAPPRPGDVPSYTTTVPYMPPGYCSQRSATAFLQPGTYTSYAYIDFTQKVTEKNENNNFATTSYVVGGLGPDLVLKGLNAAPGPLGSSTRYEIEVCNDGPLTAPASTVHLFYNKTSAPTQSQAAFANKTAPLSSLASKSCSKLTIFGTPSPGSNTSWAAVDLLDQVAEVSDANNTKSVVVIVPSATTNLQLKDFDAKPSLTGPTLYSAKVCNTGTTQTPPTNVRFYFDRPSAPPVGAAGDQSHSVSALPGGACVTITSQVNHPVGSYTSWAFVDPTDALKETNETDNIVGPLVVSVSGGSTTPCEDACRELVSPCGLLPASQEQSCVTNCKSLPQSNIDCAGTAAKAGKCADIVICLFT